ncbi:Transcriptional regulatory protein SrrA [compost metagenome]
MKDKRILIIDDEAPMRELLNLYLKAEGYTTEEASEGRSAIKKLKQTNYHLVLLDIMMPEMDGFDICREIRKFSKVPIIMLTAREQTVDKVVGLRIGADDYITKPFEQQELLARIETIFRREQFFYEEKQEQKTSNELSYKDLFMNLRTHQVFYQDKELFLTPKEYAILQLFLSNKRRLFGRDDILELIWASHYIGDYRTVDTHIKNIRDKLTKAGIPGQEVIQTVWGTGYICNETSKDK